ncbi:Nif3-like dinuclear metal center hexameric protein [Spiroplasma sp. BIUS-1]|uniref:Nif3-like dinuclear metal center hexameric protein n=1 Tax=Spiroplasma sp. BIUS-1 TaxID=216964 RepID=UPI0013970115|nr:Nif3-like dinuclear metal center hexameric protein [Spiroplasma sp. BIUS-1]QHX36802.1 Nif3-like dinuclear metal center hexameric protein [Spiroplasma sp. BIUS-1]
MTKIKANALVNYLNDVFPQKNAAEWDKVGLQLEEVYNLESQDEIEHVVICLDVTKEVVNYAIENKANFIISRHPFLFLDFESEMKNLAKKEIYEMCLENEIQIFSIHTNYDNSDKQNIMDLIETQLNVKGVDKVGEFNEGYKIKLLRPVSLKEAVDKLKFVFGKQQSLLTRNSDFEKEIETIYLTPGSGASTMLELQLRDTFFVTGEAKWSEWLYADQNNVTMLTLGHYMENHFIDDLENKLLKTFGDEVKISAFDIKNTFIII